MKAHRKERLPENLQKCEFEGTPSDDDERGWRVTIPEDADVQIKLLVKGSNGHPVTWGGGNIPGTYELRRIEDGDSE